MKFQPKELGLRIYIGKNNGEQKADCVLSVGPARGFSQFTPSLVHETNTWMILHTLESNIYCFHKQINVDRNNEPGYLQIFVVIPAVEQLKGKSPLDLLKDIYDMFKTTQVNGTYMLWQIPASEISRYKEILDIYDVEERRVYVPLMSGNKPASIRVNRHEQLSSLMAFSRYPAFGKVAHVEIGYNCQPTISLQTGEVINKPEEPETKDANDNPQKEETNNSPKGISLEKEESYVPNWITTEPIGIGGNNLNKGNEIESPKKGKRSIGMTICLIIFFFVILALCIWYCAESQNSYVY